MKPNKRLDSTVIDHNLEVPSGSEDELELSNGDSDDDMNKIQDLVVGEFEVPSGILQNDPNSIPSRQPSNTSYSSQPSTSGVVNSRSRRTSSRAHPLPNPSSVPPAQPTVNVRRMKRRYIWKKTEFQPPVTTFTGDDILEEPYMGFETPLQYFLYFFDDDLLEHIAEESTKYSIQKDPSKPLLVSKTDTQKFLGICLLLGLVPQPNIRMFWDSDLGLPIITETMTLTDFEKIRSVIHFNDNQNFIPRDQLGHDRLFRIRPILEALKKKCQAVPKRETLSVDEQMCATKACNFLRQYLPNKPHKWGYKLLVLCDDKGFAYNFEVYSGTENADQFRLPDEPDLGASSNIVVRLCRCVPRNKNYKVFFDNYYTSPELVSYLAKIGIHSLGTVNKGRLGSNLQLPSQKQLSDANKTRGYSEEWVTTVDGVPVTTVMWLDSKPVILLSSLSVSSLKTNWLLYKRVESLRQNTKLMKLREFRLEVAKSLCLSGASMTRKRGRPTSYISDMLDERKKKKPKANIPPKDVRIDGIDHFPCWSNVRQRSDATAAGEQQRTNEIKQSTARGHNRRSQSLSDNCQLNLCID
ncbi:piggyBac transposable element-derived protein 3-like [Eupeodes corollae]|uniref:piggyBac transposable element-derived protein 3-like n=1 Tax=Eupeodes corollae TaxID=290404 RepID=UPI0024922647|nr:piggyBac transposable element-derived protein 3-like [Eupeodes corollae]